MAVCEISGGGMMKTEISKQNAIKYLERKSFPGWDACSDKPTVSLSDAEYLIDLIYGTTPKNKQVLND